MTLMSTALQQVLFAFVLTLVLIRLLAPLAPRLRLVDDPDHRKHHQGSIPVVGGIAILLTLIVSALFWSEQSQDILSGDGSTLLVFLIAASILTVLGIIDDIRGVSVFSRVVVEVIVSLIVIEGLMGWSAPLLKTH